MRIRYWSSDVCSSDLVLGSGVARVRISPEAVDEASHHVIGLFGAGPEERVHHAPSRVQAMLGHRGVLTPAVGGGRWLKIGTASCRESECLYVLVPGEAVSIQKNNNMNTSPNNQ